MEAVGQRGETLHMGQSQQAAEEAVEGGLVLPLLLELLSQLEEALPPPVQHPQSQPEPALPPIRAPPAEDERSSLRHSSQTPQVERRQPHTNTHRVKDLKSTAAHTNTRREMPQRCEQPCLWTRSQGQVAKEQAPETHTGTIHSTPSSQAAPGKEDRGSRSVFGA